MSHLSSKLFKDVNFSGPEIPGGGAGENSKRGHKFPNRLGSTIEDMLLLIVL